MKKNNKNGLSPLALVLIITASIVAAAGIILLVLKFVQKKREKCALDCCDCCDELDSWEFDDEDLFGDLSFDGDEEIAASVDEAIDAVGEVSAEIEDAE